MTLLELKQITPQMLSAVLELDQLCFDGLWTLEGYQRELESPNSDLISLSIPVTPAALLGMGCMWTILEEAHITLLAVHPDYQRQGLGQSLLLALLTIARDRGLERATLEVRATNQPALTLYQKFGFKTAGRRRGYYKDTGEDALILWHGDLQYPQFQQSLAEWEQAIGDRLQAADWDLQMNFNSLLGDPYA